MKAVPEAMRTDALDIVVRLLFELGDEAEGEDDPFWDRICEAVCRRTSLERAVLLIYDLDRRLVLPVGSHGVDPGILAHMYGTLEETPIAQRALAEDTVIVVDELPGHVPDRYARLPSVSGISCTPVAAGGRWLGVIFADRGGKPLELGEDERRTMQVLGRTAALATTVRQATAQRERGRLLLERIELAREVHERVMQRLFGVSMALGADRDLGSDDADRCAAEVEAALGELRDALARSLEPTAGPSRTTLRAELQRLGRQYKALPLQVTWEDGAEVPAGLEPLAVSVLTEALRNAEKHARPSHVWVSVGRTEGAFALEVRNDGLGRAEPQPGSGLGLRLASYESLQRGGMLEFGREGDEWRIRLVLPAGDVASVVAGPPSEAER
ncbi:MAG: GAF domain-containing sensor histidine kinase [Solirubrobacterales bacterium]